MNQLDAPISDHNVILKLIPHRPPFVMVDRVDYMSADRIVSGLVIEPDNMLVKDGRFSAAGLVEHVAQSIALHKGYQYYRDNKPAPTGYLGAIKKFEILDLPRVSQVLCTTVTILHEIMGVTLVESETSCEGRILARGTLKTALA